MNKNTLVRSTCTILAAVLCGCSTIDSHTRVEGWPELKVVEHEPPYGQMYRECRPYVGALSAPLACTVFYLDAGEAHIYVAKGLRFGPIVAHERLHAAGYDHPGSHNMRDILARWKTQKLVAQRLAEDRLAAPEATKLARAKSESF